MLRTNSGLLSGPNVKSNQLLHHTKVSCNTSEATSRTHIQYNKDGHILTDSIHLLNVHSPVNIMYAVQNERNLANNPQYLAL